MSEIILINPKYPANLGAIVRVASAYGIEKVTYTGSRIKLDKLDRIPRELRMKEYKHVKLYHCDRPLSDEVLANGQIPIAVEFKDESEDLIQFRHPENAVYVFGPEDGDIPKHISKLCYRFVRIPTLHCLNLATAVATIAYDRTAKQSFSKGLHA